MSESTRPGGANGDTSGRSLLLPDAPAGGVVPQAEFVERAACINCGGKDLLELSRGRFTDDPLRSFIRADPWGEDPLPHLQDAEWVFVRCADCRQKFHARVLSPEWEQRRFARWMSAEAIEEFERRLPDPTRRKLDKGRHYAGHILRIDALTRPIRRAGEPVRFLDFGCGWGECLAMAQLFGFDVRGVDRSTARRQGCRVPVAASLAELAEPPASFHAVALFETLEHLGDPAGVLRELAPYLMRGGVLILETPDCAGITGIRSEHDYRMIGPMDHINAFTTETLRSIAERAAGVCRIPRRATYVTADAGRVLRTAVKRVLRHDDRSTQLSFVKV
jgi:SAM-dependent methyltransferase